MEQIKTRMIKPEFLATVRSGGKVEVLTVPKHVLDHFDIGRGDKLLIEIKGVEKGESLWTGNETQALKGDSNKALTDHEKSPYLSVVHVPLLTSLTDFLLKREPGSFRC